jgi:hypothetical protein
MDREQVTTRPVADCKPQNCRISGPTRVPSASRQPRERIEVPDNRPRESSRGLIRNATGPEGG